MRKISINRWFFLALVPVVLVAIMSVWLLSFSGSGRINQATYQKLELGMTYEEAHSLLGSRFDQFEFFTNAQGNQFNLRFGYSDDEESSFPSRPTIWITVDGNRLASKEYKNPSVQMIWERLILKIKVASGMAPPPAPLGLQD